MHLTRELVWLVGEVVTVAHFAIAGWVTYHALLNKRAVGSAVAWIGIAWLSPFLGGALYYAFGINEDGQISGAGDHDGEYRAFIMTPND